MGGLTVLKALECSLPGQRFVYLGDTARLPYGTKSSTTVSRYAQQAADQLVARGVKMLVVACNTASAVALDDLRRHFEPLPVIGVVQPGAEAACRASRSGVIAVLGTESTIAGGAYQAAIARLRPDARVHAAATPLFVALAEEGWTDGEVTRAAARRYLEPVLLGIEGEWPDCLVLGCTHFPVLAAAIGAMAGDLLRTQARAIEDVDVVIVDSADTTASHVHHELSARGLLRRSTEGSGPAGRARLLATDAAQRFARVGTVFLGRPLVADDVELIDL